MGFTKKISYEFEVNDFGMSASEIEVQPARGRGNIESVRIEETRKNGQEDCHMIGFVIRSDSTEPWQWECGGSSFDMYGDDGLSDAVLEYMNNHPFPAS